MQQYFYSNPPPQINNPSSSKALTKLKNDKLIVPNQNAYAPPDQSFQNRSLNNNRPLTYNNSRETFHPRNISPSPNQSNLLSSRQNRPAHTYSTSQVSQNIHTQSSQRLQTSTATYSQSNPPPVFTQGLHHKPSHPTIPVTQNESINQSIMKPLSAANNKNFRNVAASTHNQTRIRSSSTNQFNLNQNTYFNQRQAEQRISYLDGKINDYSQQIINATTKIARYESQITQFERQISALRSSNKQIQLQLFEFKEKSHFMQNKLAKLQLQNEKLKSSKAELDLQNEKNMQKVMTLQSNLDKILQSKNLQIQSLNHTCMQLSKNVELLHQNYSQQIQKLNDTIKNQQSTINHTKGYFDNVNERIKFYEQNSSTRERDIQILSKLSNDQINKITSLQVENKSLKIELSNYIQRQEMLKRNYYTQKDQNSLIKQQLNRVVVDYENAKKIGQQQIQFLQSKLQQSNLQKQRLIEQVQLKKAINQKKNAIFQRQIIYELKAQNDRLWLKLIDQSENKPSLTQNDPQYIKSKKLSVNYQSKISNHPVANTTYPFVNNNFDLNNAYRSLQEQYLRFVEQLERQQQKASQLIGQFSSKYEKNNIQDALFYKKKCINLEEMVEEHLKINLNLKDQLEKAQSERTQVNPTNSSTNTQIIFLKNQLSKQQILNQTLQRSFELVKSEYQVKFKAAQQRVTQIQHQQQKIYNGTDNLRKELSQAQYQILRLTNQNFAIKNRLQSSPSQQTKYQDMYYDLLSGIQKRGFVSQFNSQPNPQNIDMNAFKDQNQSLKQQIKKKDEQYQKLLVLQKQNQQQLAKKSNLMAQLQTQHQKLASQYQNNKSRVDQIIKQFNRVQKQLASYKRGNYNTNLSMSGVNIQLNDSMSMSGHLRMSGNRGFDKKMAIYYTSMLRAKLIELEAFVKELKEVHLVLQSSLRVQGVGALKEAPYILDLIVNSQRVIQNCLDTCSQLQVNCKQ